MENRDRSPERDILPQGRWDIDWEDQWHAGHWYGGRSINDYRYSRDRQIVEIKVSNWQTHRRTFIVDAEDLDKIKGVSWHLQKNKRGLRPYWMIACSQCRGNDQRFNGFPRNTVLSRYLSNYNGPLKLDHLDKNTMNNRKSINLRIVTSKENANNRPLRKDNTSGKNGITLLKARWEVNYTKPNGKKSSKSVVCGENEDVIPNSLQHWIQQKIQEGYERPLNPIKISPRYQLRWYENRNRCYKYFEDSQQGFRDATAFRDEKYEEIDNYNNGRTPPLNNEMQ